MKLGQNHSAVARVEVIAQGGVVRLYRAIIIILPIWISCLKLLHHLINTMPSAMTAASITPG